MVNFKCLPASDPNSNWNYCPSFGAAILFSILFGIVTIAHITQGILYRKSYTWVLIMGALWETGGLASRVVSVTKQSEEAPAFASQLLVLLAPLWVNAFAYMTLGRIIYFFLPDTAIWRIRPRRLTVYFVCFDIITFLVQAFGASEASSSNPVSTQRTGLHIYMGGIGLQELLIVIFTALALCFHKELNRRYTTSPPPEAEGSNLRTLDAAHTTLYTLYTVLGLISIRIIFRLVEYSSGTNSYLTDHEWPSYVFDFTVMTIALTVLVVLHPGRFLRGEGSEFPKLSKQEKREEKRAYKDARIKAKNRDRQGWNETQMA